MTDRATELRTLAEGIRERDAVADAFVAKSFTDRLLIVDVDGDSLPADVESSLAAHDLRPASGVYGDDADAPSAFGDVGDATRHHYVDVRTRGRHQSYVVE